ncbi:MAG: RagB/SusD family nutrient uptake outer membrane protein [Bacteroidaceae bacterium]|nr:RagB/SusD family nutrient uptake outer membrane protein [Bacteroidaceae bacterium]
MKKIKSLACIALVGLSVSSCKDFLTLMPLNDIVLENFWTDMNDVESVLLGSYAALESSDCVMRMLVWGEMRSDNVVKGSGTPETIEQILEDDILSTNDYVKYKCFYDVINRANTVLHFAKEVEDPNYSPGELAANEAEATALRCLSYWYLIRAYKDVPYVTEPSIDDTRDFFIGQSPFDSILNCLITDLEAVKRYAPNKYPTELANTSRITRATIYAMLADMYLWKGDWDKCIENCDSVTSRKMVEYKEILHDEGTSCMIDLYGKNADIPLLREMFQSSSGPRLGYAYSEIFGSGNSFETLFELPFGQGVEHPFVKKYYCDKTQTGGYSGGYLKGSKMASKDIWIQKYDGRYYQDIRSAQSDDDFIVKYVYETLEYDLTSGTIDMTNLSNNKKFKATQRNNSEPNWIIYRYADVLLMKAEALVMKAKDGADQDSCFKAAFDLVDAVNKRALGKYSGGGYSGADYLDYNKYSLSVDAMEELVLDERRRELMFEGKRWFDLTRKSMRDGNTSYMWKKIQNKFDSSSSNAVRIKMTDLNALYFPIYKDEIKINNKLKQNPVYVEDEFIKKAE